MKEYVIALQHLLSDPDERVRQAASASIEHIERKNTKDAEIRA
ncbi:MAG TPA: hypothetical protein VMS89_09975 [Methanoregulaceae archaeon]|nr:hypothetical protein [Methanoregulaceae archaeon]